MATYYNPVVKLSLKIEAEIMKDGKSVKVVTPGYRCDGPVNEQGSRCALVWAFWDQAKECKARGHKNRYYAEYTHSDGTVARYVRVADHRAGPRPEVFDVQAPVPVPSPAAPAQALVPTPSLADVRAMALALGYRLSRIPSTKGALENLTTISTNVSESDGAEVSTRVSTNELPGTRGLD